MKIKVISLLAALMLALGGCSAVAVQSDVTAADTAIASTTVVSTTTASTSTDGTTVESAAANAMPAGAPPAGAPPAGEPPAGGPPGGAPGGSDSSVQIVGAFTLSGESQTSSGEMFTADGTDESAIYVTAGGSLTVTDAAISSSGGSSSSDNSSFYGLNAVVLAADGGTISLSDSTVTSTGDGANGVFATGEGSTVNLANVTIDATGQYAHAVMATRGGVMTLTDVNMTTAGASSGAIATDRGSGVITVSGGVVETSGQNSPGIYSTGVITVTGADITATGAEAAVIEGANSIALTDTNLRSTFADKWGVMIYQSMSGDAEGTRGEFTMAGGSLAYTDDNGPLFYVTNSTGVITLSNVELTAGGGVLAQAGVNRWGSEGANGGNIIFIADSQALQGDFLADSISTLDITLQNGSTLTGAINADNAAQSASLALDAASTWTVTADSYLTCLADEEAIDGAAVSNIIGNGYTVYYNAGECPALGGQTYSLSGGGTLTPVS